jgi:biopolymer transport protein ExbD
MRTLLMRNMSSRRSTKPVELLLVPMIDIFTVLVTFLLMTAVFSRITILQLDLPSSAGGPTSKPTFRLEVIIRQNGLELTDGNTLISGIPKVTGAYDLKELSQQVLLLKRMHADANDASVLSEPRIPYDDVIQVMDAIRSTEVVEGSAKAQKVDLFTNIAMGDAP